MNALKRIAFVIVFFLPGFVYAENSYFPLPQGGPLGQACFDWTDRFGVPVRICAPLNDMNDVAAIGSVAEEHFRRPRPRYRSNQGHNYVFPSGPGSGGFGLSHCSNLSFDPMLEAACLSQSVGFGSGGNFGGNYGSGGSFGGNYGSGGGGNIGGFQMGD